MDRKIKKIENSFIRRIVWMMAGLLLLDVLILGAVWKYSNSVLERNMDEDITHLLNIYATALETVLDNTDANLITLARERGSLEELSNPDDANRYYASMRIAEKIQSLCSYNDGVDMLLAIGNYANDVSDASGRMTVFQRDEIIDFMEEKREKRRLEGKLPTGTSGYVQEEVGTTQYLLRTYDTQTYSISAWIQVETLISMLRKMDRSSGRHIFLLNGEGKCIGAILEKDAEKFEDQQNGGRTWKSEIGRGGLTLVCCVETSDLYGQISLIPITTLLVIVVTILLLFRLFQYMSREIFAPIRNLMQAISYVQEGNFQHRVENHCKNKEFSSLNAAFNSMLDTIVGLRIQEYEKQLQLHETELKYFQLQIRPHFFLNALATIHSMTFENRFVEIRAFISALSKNIRYMFKAGLHTVALKEEWNHLEHYFEMQELLYPGCVFYFIERRAEYENWKIPQMLLHIFIENKYKYGLKEGELLSVYISAEHVVHNGKRTLKIRIEDDGKPFPEEIVGKEYQNAVREDGGGVGFYNAEKTLEIMYGDRDLLAVENREEGGTRISILIPEDTVL